MLEQVSTGHYRLHGHIDMQASDPALLHALMHLPSGQQDIVLDVATLESADSLLLAILLDVKRTLVRRGASLRITGLSDSMRGLARVYGIEGLLEEVQ